ncbi:MAG TPA: hypothetical protein VIZ86_16545 [Pseudomonas sp.]
MDFTAREYAVLERAAADAGSSVDELVGQALLAGLRKRRVEALRELQAEIEEIDQYAMMYAARAGVKSNVVPFVRPSESGILQALKST